MSFDEAYFDTLYDLKTPAQVLAKMRAMRKEIQELKEDYRNMHRAMREQGEKLPKDLPHEI